MALTTECLLSAGFCGSLEPIGRIVTMRCGALAAERGTTTTEASKFA